MMQSERRKLNPCVARMWLPLLAAGMLTFPRAYGYDWLQFGGDDAHGSANTLEHTLDAGNVATLARKYTATLPAVADGAPVGLRGVQLPSGPVDILFVTTTRGDIVAIDAASGAQIWSKPHGPGTCKINKTGGPCYTTSSPALDPNRQFVYTYGLDGFVHKHGVVDGTEVTTGGWPQLSTLKPFHEKGSSALGFASSGTSTFLYSVHGGYPGDNGDYQGHLTAIDLASGAQKVFNAMCSDVRAHLGEIPGSPTPPPPDPYCSRPRSAIWSRPGVIHDSATGRIFVSTGNGTYTGNADGLNWSESILALNPDGSSVAVRPIDSYTPTNFASLDSSDADLGSTSIAIIPMPAGSAVPHLGVQGGKDSKLRLINLDNLANAAPPPASGRVGGEVSAIVSVPQGGGVFSQPAVWINPINDKRWVFVATGGGVSGFTLELDGAGHPLLVSRWTIPQGGTSPIIAGNVLFYAGGSAVRAVNPVTGDILWTSSPGTVGSIHWQSPVVFNGAVYITDQNSRLLAFAPASAPASVGFDVDADRHADIAWQSTTGQTALWKMNGLDASAATVVMSDVNWRLAATTDLNDDGKSDFVWKNQASGATALWLMNGPGAMAATLAMPNGAWNAIGFPDLNGDGFRDIAWRNSATGATALWLMNGLTPIGSSLVMANGTWTLVSAGDFDGDGRDDLVWRNETTGETAIWLMDGVHAHAAAVVTSAPWTVVAVGDFDGDGKSDLVMRNATSGATALWLMNGLVSSSSDLMTDANWSVSGAGDFNGDGRADLLWRNMATGATALWLMDGPITIGSRTLMTDANWSIAQIADIDGDGHADIFWHNSQSGASIAWLMNGLDASAIRLLQSTSTWTLVSPAH
jgi:VCBS repeat protein/FG-GAP repeat protein/putative pyrroloquinoline-quinone-binding quinoprotein